MIQICNGQVNYRAAKKKYAGSKKQELKRDALILYLEGLGFRSIGRYLKISHVAVYNWIKSYGKKLEELKSDEVVQVVEIDELHTYIMSKKTTVGYGLLLIDIGKNSSIAFLAPEARKLGKSYGRK